VQNSPCIRKGKENGQTFGTGLMIGMAAGFKFFLLPSRVHARPSASQRKPLGDSISTPNTPWKIAILGIDDAMNIS